MVKYKKYNFILDFFQKGRILPFYNSLINLTNKKTVGNRSATINDLNITGIHEVKFIPYYFTLTNSLFNSHYKIVTCKRINHFIINLKGFTHADDYLKRVLNAKNRKQLNSKKRRLETCFKITYKTYFGNISKENYNSLIFELKRFIDRRFQERGDKFFLESKWDQLLEETYKLVLTKKASLFVIYNQEKPISIGITYHFQNIVQSFIASYDVDYSKFGIGHIAIYKKIEWCIANNFLIFDFMWGDVPHKRHWCNEIGKYEHHFIFRKNFLNRLKVNVIIKGYLAFDKIKTIRILKIIRGKNLGFSKFKSICFKDPETKYFVEKLKSLPSSDKFTEVKIDNDQYSFLKKLIYDFQYSNFEKAENVKVFKFNRDENSFLIAGENSQIKVSAHQD